MIRAKIFKSNKNFKALPFKTFKETDDTTRKKHGPLIKRYVRLNQEFFINKKKEWRNNEEDTPEN